MFILICLFSYLSLLSVCLFGRYVGLYGNTICISHYFFHTYLLSIFRCFMDSLSLFLHRFHTHLKNCHTHHYLSEPSSGYPTDPGDKNESISVVRIRNTSCNNKWFEPATLGSVGGRATVEPKSTPRDFTPTYSSDSSLFRAALFI